MNRTKLFFILFYGVGIKPNVVTFLETLNFSCMTTSKIRKAEHM